MEYGNQVASLVSELERQKKSKVDVVVGTHKLRATTIADGNDIGLFVPVPNGIETRTELVALTDFAHGQLSEKLQIPKRYYDRMRESNMGDLLARNVNAWIPKKDRRLVRMLDYKVRAILSDRYKIMDNYDLVFASLDVLKNVGAEIHRCDLTETHLYLKAVVPHTVEEIRKGDRVIPGVVIRNSEVGCSAFAVECFILRQVCSNGLIAPQKIAKIHLGERQDVGIYRNETRELENRVIWEKVKDIISATFNPKIFHDWCEQLRTTATVQIEKPVDAVNNVVEAYKICDDAKKDLLNHFTKEGDSTQWGLVNAVTRTARDQEDYEKQITLERIGGQISTLAPDAFQKLLTK